MQHLVTVVRTQMVSLSCHHDAITLFDCVCLAFRHSNPRADRVIARLTYDGSATRGGGGVQASSKRTITLFNTAAPRAANCQELIRQTVVFVLPHVPHSPSSIRFFSQRSRVVQAQERGVEGILRGGVRCCRCRKILQSGKNNLPNTFKPVENWFEDVFVTWYHLALPVVRSHAGTRTGTYFA